MRTISHVIYNNVYNPISTTHVRLISGTRSYNYPLRFLVNYTAPQDHTNLMSTLAEMAEELHMTTTQENETDD